MAKNFIKPLDPEFAEIPPQILHDRRYMPYFKDCIGAIDGTHIQARVSVDEQISYIGRKGLPTQNVMAACDFHMCFTFVAAGWEGSAHDPRIFNDATRRPKMNFLHPPNGKYYLVDSGYPTIRGFLRPYRETKYHLSEFRLTKGPKEKEIFNKMHSSI
ncbi:uncharacterized protein [Rutidosis leptorrhynchoides]|uniref:uncharacterized protein n=1 Tax=Rutidosis leptorrhynchoides TaxID=125765 RepID=UPI003A9A636F